MRTGSRISWVLSEGAKHRGINVTNSSTNREAEIELQHKHDTDEREKEQE